MQAHEAGTSGGVAGETNTLVVTTYDDAGRRRATRGDRFACVLRMPGSLEDGQEERLVGAERPSFDNGDGTHELTYVCAHRGS